MESATPTFFYTEFTARNLGFLSAAEQEKLRTSHVFVCGVGAVGGAALQSLVRMGAGSLSLADVSVFEVSSLNHQPYATMDTVGTEKIDAALAGIHAVNSHANVKTYGAEWPAKLASILSDADVVINGMSDTGETIKLYRACRAHGCTLIDAYSAPLPSVFVTRAGEPTPEERLQFPTLGKAPEDWTREDLTGAALQELEYVMACSSSREYISLQAVTQMALGTRARMSFAPMVMLTGSLMAHEASRALLNKPSGATYQGYFLDPHTGKIERPPGRVLEWRRRRKVRRELAELTHL